MTRLLYLLFILALLIHSCEKQDNEWIRINLLGYTANDVKVAVFMGLADKEVRSFRLVDVKSGKTVFESNNIVKSMPLAPFKSCIRLPFTEFIDEGIFRIETGKTASPEFRISDDIYDGTADFLLNYMRQQRCGFNPFLDDSCHTHDGYVIYGGPDDYSHIDVTGGWHDAADYLQYVATSANATYQMLYAYSANPAAFSDNYLASGLPGKDNIPDILNESKWGLDWLLKMNPAPGIMYNQIADDRDHIGFRFPNTDTASYGKGCERPVYRCTGRQQGLFEYKNRATGIASTAGKFASAFARGADVYKPTDPEFSNLLILKAIEAFKYGLKHPGACQTAPGTAPYFYEEDNWVDDMELAAIELYIITKEEKYLNYAVEFGRRIRTQGTCNTLDWSRYCPALSVVPFR